MNGVECQVFDEELINKLGELPRHVLNMFQFFWIQQTFYWTFNLPPKFTSKLKFVISKGDLPWDFYTFTSWNK